MAKCLNNSLFTYSFRFKYLDKKGKGYLRKLFQSSRLEKRSREQDMSAANYNSEKLSDKLD